MTKQEAAILEIDNFLCQMRQIALGKNMLVVTYLNQTSREDLEYKLLLALKLMDDLIKARL